MSQRWEVTVDADGYVTAIKRASSASNSRDWVCRFGDVGMAAGVIRQLVQERDDMAARIDRASKSLCEIQYFHECTPKHRAWAWDALNALDPELAELSANDPKAGFDSAHSESNDS